MLGRLLDRQARTCKVELSEAELGEWGDVPVLASPCSMPAHVGVQGIKEINCSLHGGNSTRGEVGGKSRGGRRGEGAIQDGQDQLTSAGLFQGTELRRATLFQYEKPCREDVVYAS